jgi:hypothetical protein
MILDDLAPEAITEDVLQRLIQSQIAESYSVEYKQTLYGGSDADKRELLKDVSALANSRGGHIVFGMRERAGLPQELVGLADDRDASIQRIENLCRDCIQPRITGLRPVQVPLAAGNWALVLRVPRSWNRPHRVAYQTWTKYFLRNAAGVHEASVDELRELFTDATTREARASAFVSERVNLIEDRQAPITIRDGARVILHIVPFGALAGEYQIDLTKSVECGRFAPIGTTGYNYGFNLYGLITYRNVQENGYTQVFRNGIVETVGTDIGSLGNGQLGIHGFSLGKAISRAVESYVLGYAAVEVPPPVSVFVTLTGTYGIPVVCGDGDGQPLPVPRVRLPEVTLTSFGPGYQGALRPIMNAIWNAGGAPQCSIFHDDGRWTP